MKTNTGSKDQLKLSYAPSTREGGKWLYASQESAFICPKEPFDAQRQAYHSRVRKPHTVAKP